MRALGGQFTTKKTICEKNLNWQCLNMVFCKLTVKNMRAIQETQDLILRSERSPGEGNGYCSSILAWRIPWTEETGGLQTVGSQRVRRDSVTNTFTFTL